LGQADALRIGYKCVCCQWNPLDVVSFALRCSFCVLVHAITVRDWSTTCRQCQSANQHARNHIWSRTCGALETALRVHSLHLTSIR